ncbi:hypothetical protein ACFWNG_14215 [Streptomyces sp. NPDC058391]|uniref:hypothetical protein n=1 Tax=Streptomyces sp. NPDC058391 TaxID=3346476 RepID=UPI00365AF41C
MAGVRDRSLSALLAEAIEQVTDNHRDTCDVADPISPSATVAILRANRNRPGGFWVAKDDPRAADEAITGSCPAPRTRRSP